MSSRTTDQQNQANHMETKLKITLASLCIAMAALTITGCKTNGRSSDNGMHNMGTSKTGYMMRDDAMPGHR